MNRVGGGVTIDQYGMTIVDFKKIGYKDEPFILAKDVAQVFYVKDMSSKPIKNSVKSEDEPKCHIVLPGNEKSLELRIFRTSQKTLISLMTVLHSRSMLTPASCYPKRTLLTCAMIMIKGHSEKERLSMFY